MDATGITQVALLLSIFVAAVLYSSVGHAGASGYLAAMALFGVAPETMRPAALTLNVLVATIATARFYRAGYFAWHIFWPFALASIPFAYLGGTISLSGYLYRPAVGLVMLVAAYRLATPPGEIGSRRIATPVGLACGAAVGMLAGLTGTGGGIFLSPLLILMGWAEVKQTSGVSAAFVLVNSIAGLAGLATKSLELPAMLPYWAMAAVIGGVIGSELGTRRLANQTLRRLLAAVLVIAAAKLILT